MKKGKKCVLNSKNISEKIQNKYISCDTLSRAPFLHSSIFLRLKSRVR